MTDKQIIIDGVDVSGCPHLIEDYPWWNVAGREEHDKNRCALSFDEYIDFEEDEFCKNNPNCYYKQHKRKEQECEELKKIIYEAKNSKLDLKSFLVGEAIQNEYEEQLDQLKLQLAYKEADEEEIKRIIKPYLAREDDLEVYDLDWIIKGFCNELDQLKAKNEELKEEVSLLKKQLEPLQDKYFKGLDTIAIAGLAKLILQKISECDVGK